MTRLRNLTKKILPILLGLLIPIIQSCANSEIGSKLSDSFEYSPDELLENSSSLLKRKGEKNKTRKIDRKNEVKSINNAKNNSEFTNNRTLTNQKKKNRLKSQNTLPTKLNNRKAYPYRLIIRLSGVNPNDPIGALSSALRESGIEFEVEKLERLSTNSNQSLRK